MERLTQWIDDSRAIPRVDLKRCGHERCTTQLAGYEDTGLDPEQVMKLKERDTAKEPRMIGGISLYATCLSCRQIICNFYRFCPECGQRLKREGKENETD